LRGRGSDGTDDRDEGGSDGRDEGGGGGGRRALGVAGAGTTTDWVGAGSSSSVAFSHVELTGGFGLGT